MQDFLNEYSFVIITSLSVLSLILLVIILVDHLYIKKRLYEKIKEQEEKLLRWNAWYHQTAKQKVFAKKDTVQQAKVSQSLANKTNLQGTLSNRIQTVGTSTVSLTNSCVDSSNSAVATAQKPQAHTYHYLQEANRGRFMKLLPSSEKSFFRTWEDGGGRKFEFCGNVDKALANINAIFDDVCEIEGKRSGATYIENVSAGTLDSELRIITKAKIRLK